MYCNVSKPLVPATISAEGAFHVDTVKNWRHSELRILLEEMLAKIRASLEQHEGLLRRLLEQQHEVCNDIGSLKAHVDMKGAFVPDVERCRCLLPELPPDGPKVENDPGASAWTRLQPHQMPTTNPASPSILVAGETSPTSESSDKVVKAISSASDIGAMGCSPSSIFSMKDLKLLADAFRHGEGGISSKSFAKESHTSRLGQFVSSIQFDLTCMFVIIANTIYMGVSSHKEVTDAIARSDDDEDQAGTIIELAFFGFYAIEMLLKFTYWRFYLFRGAWARWNIFDIVLLVVSAISFTGVEGASSLNFLRVFKLVSKIVRALRIVNVVKYFHELRIMLLAITLSFKTFVWCMLTMGLLMYISAVIFIHGVANYLRMTPPELIEDEIYDACVKHWGSIGKAMLTNYAALTAGGPWGPSAVPLEAAGPFYYGLFLAYTGVLQLAVLKLLTGIFTQTAKAVFDHDHELTIEQNMRALFKDIDADGSGSITQSEFDRHLMTPIAQNFMTSLNLNPSDLMKLIHLIDAGDDGLVDIEEFVAGCKRVKGGAKNLDMIITGARIEDIALQLGSSSDSLHGRFQHL